jgi:Protein of unknown function (DUF2946)
MVGGVHGLTRVGRQLAAIVLTFALLLQGVATGRPAASAATDANSATFELCHHNSSADEGNASAPAGVPENSDAHCIFCLAGASYALQAPVPSVAFHIIIIAIVPWTFTVWRLPALTVDGSARARGPPTTA